MATSGTIGSTVIDAAKIVDHAVRRCGSTPSTLTPEQVESALENLYLILSSLVNRGINLWCIDEEWISLAANQSDYTLNPGTIAVLSANYRTTTALSNTGTFATASYTADFVTDVAVKTIGVYYNTTREHDFVLEVSTDNTTWATVKDLGTVNGYAGQWSWHDIDPSFSTRYFRIRDTRPDPQNNFNNLGVEVVRLCNAVHEVSLAPISRDTYNSVPNKRQPSRPSMYYFDRQITPRLVLVPEPNDPTAHLLVRRQRLIQDVTSLQETLEVPERWLEAIIWKLSAVMAYELPNIEEKRRLECVAHSASSVDEAENGDTDGAPIYIQPKISGYTA